MKLTRSPPRNAKAYAMGEPAWRYDWNEERSDPKAASGVTPTVAGGVAYLMSARSASASM